MAEHQSTLTDTTRLELLDGLTNHLRQLRGLLALLVTSEGATPADRADGLDLALDMAHTSESLLLRITLNR